MRVAPHSGTPTPLLSLYMRAPSHGNCPPTASSPSVIRNVSAVLVPHESEFREEKLETVEGMEVGDVGEGVVVVVEVVKGDGSVLVVTLAGRVLEFWNILGLPVLLSGTALGQQTFRINN